MDLASELALLILITGFFMVGRKSLRALIRFYTLQNLLLAFLAFVLAESHAVFILAGVLLFLIKGILIPAYLLWLLDRLEVSHEVESYLSVPLSLLVGGGLVGLGFWAGGAFVLPATRLPEAVPVAISLILLGMFSMSTRKKAITQVLGFLALENGVFLLALAESHGLPLFVELGVALDAFAAVFLAGILIFRIKQTFGHLDTARLRELRG